MPNHPNDPLRRLLIGAILASAAEKAESGAREGAIVNLSDLLGGCRHRRQLDQALALVEKRQAQLAFNGADFVTRVSFTVAAPEADFLEQLRAFLVPGARAEPTDARTDPERLPTEISEVEALRAELRAAEAGRAALLDEFDKRGEELNEARSALKGNVARADRLEVGMHWLAKQVADRRQNMRERATYMAEESWLVELESGLDEYTRRAPVKTATEARVDVRIRADDSPATVGGAAIEKVHAETAQEERGNFARYHNNGGARAGAGVMGRNPDDLTPAETATLYQVSDEIGAHLAAMCSRLNDRLPRGFFTHITIARKD